MFSLVRTLHLLRRFNFHLLSLFSQSSPPLGAVISARVLHLWWGIRTSNCSAKPVQWWRFLWESLRTVLICVDFVESVWFMVSICGGFEMVMVVLWESETVRVWNCWWIFDESFCFDLNRKEREKILCLWVGVYSMDLWGIVLLL